MKTIKMSRTILTLAVVTTLLAGTILTGCSSAESKVEDAKTNLNDAQENLKDANKEAQAAAQQKINAEEWKAFKSESEEKIRNNDIRIAELKEKIKSSGKTLDGVRANMIANLEQQNRDMKAKLDAYEKSQSDWESFKREFNHDMEEFGKAFKNLTVDNK